ncbi:MAG TPA: bifunctional metallophosphatase/5'-nucleotidase [Candidatus Binatia bacterium]
MPRTKTIYIDMDDVLCHTAQHCLKIIDREFGKAVAFEQLSTFDLGSACALQPEEIAELFRIVHHPDELIGLEPVEGGVTALRQWTAAGYGIAIVTGRPPPTYDASLEWLARHQVPYQTFTVVDKYGRFETASTIGITLSQLAERQFCWAVEDSLPMASYLADRMRVPVALMDRPWNQTDVEHSLIGRYSRWDDIVKAWPGTAGNGKR